MISLETQDSPTILIVDDQPTNLEVLYSILNQANWIVRIEVEGNQALQQIQQNPPDLILLDVMLPGLDGFNICQTLKADPKTEAIPVIFITALNDTSDKLKGFSLGAVDYITKPFQQEEVLARVQLHVQLRQMTQLLHAKNTHLQLLTEDLEQRVQERTMALQRSLQEKELLLKEIHHRVKNNLLVVSSLLGLQAEHLDDPKALQGVEDLQNRVYSMALVHEKLYKSDNLASVNLGEYLEELVNYLCESFDASMRDIEVVVSLQPILVNIETITPCGLIVSELISNIFKHAFPNHAGGKIWVSAKQDTAQNIMMTVQDNGIGLPETFNIQETDSLGLDLVCLLTEQLQGEIHHYQDNGTKFEITFAELQYGDRL